jgi:hypothetical protein
MENTFLEAVIPIDLLEIIKTFLTNKEIIELICSSKSLFLNFKSQNLFSTITISIKDWFQGIKNYLKHYKSIKNIIFIGFDKNDIENYWPFEYSELLEINLLNNKIKNKNTPWCLYVPLCKYDNFCKNEYCIHFHLHENVTKYKKRIINLSIL